VHIRARIGRFLAIIGALGAGCAPVSDRPAPVRPAPESSSKPRASTQPPPWHDVFPANPWNARRFEKFARLEPIDQEWAPIVTRQIRVALEAQSSPHARVMHVECRAETCAIGLVAWQSPHVAWPPWPDIPWSGNSGGTIEPRPDGWSELVFVLHRNARDQPSANPRVPSFARPEQDPDCRTARLDARPHASPPDPACRYVAGFAHNTLCFDLARQACACSCGRSGANPACLLGGRRLRCSLPHDPRRSVFFE
jgi:hypothetical protein